MNRPFSSNALLVVILLLGIGRAWAAQETPQDIGDLVYRDSNGKIYGRDGDSVATAKNHPGHVGIYVGNGEIVEALGHGLWIVPGVTGEVMLTPINASRGIHSYYEAWSNTTSDYDGVADHNPIGAKTHKALVDNSNALTLRQNIKLLALNQVGEGYDNNFSTQKGPGDDQWTCVGLAETVYEWCAGQSLPSQYASYGNQSQYAGGLNITPDGYEHHFWDVVAYYQNNVEFSQIPTTFLMGRLLGGTYFVFFPYTQFEQSTLIDAFYESPVAPNPPSFLSATTISSSQINLTWRDNSANESGFKIERRLSSTGSWTQVGTVGPNVTSFSDRSLTAGTKYFYQACALNSTGGSACSAEASATTQAAAGSSHILTIASSNPSSGIPVASFVGNSGYVTGQTPATRSFVSGTVVGASCAIVSPSGQAFQKWQLDGVDYAYTSVAAVTMDGPHTLTAVYGATPPPNRTLQSLTIEGPSSVDERTSAQYRARAYYTDGASAYVSADWDDDTAYADISGSGLLDTDAVSGDREIEIEATFTAGGVTKSDTKSVTIRNTDEVPTYTLTLSAQNGHITPSPNMNSYPAGTEVRLTAYPDDGYVRSHWSGDASGTERTVYITMNGDKSVTAHFSVDTSHGRLQVTLLPPEAADEGAQWKYDWFTDWRDSGNIQDGISPRINRYIHFKDIPGWITPDNFQASVVGGQTTVTNATYRELPGTVQVTLSPTQASAAGARWRLGGGPWQTSGASVEGVLPGNHQIEFQTVSGWTTPAPQPISVQRGGTSIASGVYQPPLGTPLITAVSPKTGPIAGGTLLTIEGVNFSASAAVFVGGRMASNVTVFGSTRLTAVTPASPVFGSADIVVIAGTSSATNANAFAYGVPRGTNMTLITSTGGSYQAVASNGRHLFIGQGTTFQVYDIANPSNPIFLSSVAVPGLIQAIALNGSYAILAANDAGVHVVDISNPAAPRLRGFYDTTGIAYGLRVLAGRAYVADRSRGLLILDVTNADAPALVSSLELGEFTFDVALKTSSAGLFAIVGTRGRLVVVDVSNPQSPTKVSEVEVQGDNWSVAVAGDLAFLGKLANGVDVVDISNVSSPESRGRLLESAVYVSVAATGNTVALAGRGQQAFKLLEISGMVTTPRGHLDSSQFELEYEAYRMVIQNGVAWVAGGTSVFGVAISNLDAPQRIFRREDQGGRFEKIAFTGSAFMASSIDKSYGFTYSGNTITSQASIEHEGQSLGMAVAQHVLLDIRSVYYGDVDGSRVHRVSLQPGALFQSLAPAVLKEMYPRDIYAVGDRVTVLAADHDDDHPIISEVDPTRTDPDWIVRQENLAAGPGMFAQQIVAASDFFIVAFLNQGKCRLNGYAWGSASAVWEVGGLNFVNEMKLSHGNRYLHIGMDREYRVYDVLNQANPVCVSTNAMASGINDILIDGDKAYLAAFGQGVLVYDISNITQPRLIRSYNTPGSAFSLAKISSRLMVADNHAGIQVLGLPDIVPPQVFITAPVALPEFQVANSTVTVGGGAEDDSGQISRVTWSNDRGGGGVAQGTSDWLAVDAVLLPGPNIITVTAYDAEGNSGTDQITVIYTQADTTPPAITITGPKPDVEFAVSTETITLTGSAADNQSVTSVTWSNASGGSGSATLTGQSWTVENLPLVLGPNVIQVTASDAAGNSATDTAVIFLLPPDTTPPLVTIDFPTANAVLEISTAELNLSGLASDDHGVVRVEWSDGRGGQGTAAGAFPWSVNGIALQPGLTVIEITAFDAAGNAGTDALAVTYVPPPLELQVLGVIDGVFRFRVSGPAGSTIAIQRSGDFNQWEPLGTRTISLEGTTTVEDTPPVGGLSFYRVLPQGQ